jgi:hypothetical protein
LEFVGKYHEKFAGLRWVIEFKLNEWLTRVTKARNPIPQYFGPKINRKNRIFLGVKNPIFLIISDFFDTEKKLVYKRVLKSIEQCAIFGRSNGAGDVHLERAFVVEH